MRTRPLLGNVRRSNDK